MVSILNSTTSVELRLEIESSQALPVGEFQASPAAATPEFTDRSPRLRERSTRAAATSTRSITAKPAGAIPVAANTT